MTFDFDKIMQTQKEELSEAKPKKDFKDERFIKITRDENNNGSLVVRFIIDMEQRPAVTTFKHFASKVDDNGKKSYFIANCPTTIGDKCPYCNAYLDAWKIKDQETIDELKSGKRNEKYIANVLVIKDPANPENNGKMMLFEYGYKIAQLVSSTINGDDEIGVEGINIYHPTKGANLLLKHSKQGQYITLEGSKFLTQSSIGDMTEFEALVNKTVNLNEFVDPEIFESFETLEKKFFKYRNGFELEGAGSETVAAKPAAKKPEPKVETKPVAATTAAVSDDDDSFFDDL